MLRQLLSVIQFPFRQRQNAVHKERMNITKSFFVEELAQSDLERHAAAKLWDLLVEAAVVEEFRPLPNDNFLRLYGLADEDLDDDIILPVLHSIGLDPDPQIVASVGTVESPIDVMKLIRAIQSGQD
jgi:hypothetical protein